MTARRSSTWSAARSSAARWNKLRSPAERKKDDRTWANGTPRSFRLLGDGIIEAISKGGKSVGHAILKPDQAQQLNQDLRGAGLRAPERVRATSSSRSTRARTARRWRRWAPG